MAEINTNSGKSGRRGKPSRMNLRVDFTPMVDMNMLLITFFMFCTTLAAPQVMDIVMPTKETPETGGNEYPESKTISLLLGENDKIYYYLGKPDFGNPSSLKQTNLQDLRSILLERNAGIVAQIHSLKQQKANQEISDETFKSKISEIKKSKEGQLVIIKPTKVSNYNSLIETLDEVQICNISRYAIVEPDSGDQYLIDNYNPNNEILAKVD